MFHLVSSIGRNRAAVRTFVSFTNIRINGPQFNGVRTFVSSADLDEKRRRLLYHSRQRGWLELDLILGSFAEKNLPIMSDADVEDYATLLEEETPDMFKWMSGQSPVPSELAALPVTKLLLAYIHETHSAVFSKKDH